MTRRKFYAAMRKLGFSSKGVQMARNGLTYHKKVQFGDLWVTVPKKHMDAFTIVGDVPYSGVFFKATDKPRNIGISVDLPVWGAENMFEICLMILTDTLPDPKETA